jgi:predicted adenylyl cyclase CyaB
LRNIELKARLRSRDAALSVAAGLAGSPEVIEQRDTYFQVPAGRLKLREEGERAELIFYRRADSRGPRLSEYQIAPVKSPSQLKDILERALGAIAVVKKTRLLFLYRNVRIHVDTVESLGDFIEFEAVLPEGTGDEDADRLLQQLVGAFSISGDDLVEGSYCDLIATQGRTG